MVWLPDGEKILKVKLLIWTECTNVTYGQTDRWTDKHCMTAQAALAQHRTTKNMKNNLLPLNYIPVPAQGKQLA